MEVKNISVHKRTSFVYLSDHQTAGQRAHAALLRIGFWHSIMPAVQPVDQLER